MNAVRILFVCLFIISPVSQAADEKAIGDIDLITEWKALVELNEALVKQVARDYSEGLAGNWEVVQSQVQLAESEIGLALAQKDHQAAVKHAEDLVRATQRNVRVMQRNYQAGAPNIAPADMQKARRVIIKARIRLAELRKNIKN